MRRVAVGADDSCLDSAVGICGFPGGRDDDGAAFDSLREDGIDRVDFESNVWSTVVSKSTSSVP